MKRYFIIILTFVITQSGLSQSILQAVNLKRGIYKDFNEFRTNNPSIPLDEATIVIDKDEKLLVDNVTSEGFTYKGVEVKLPIYRLRKKGSIDKGIETKEYWGYCDGSAVFINSYTHMPRHFFVQILLIGRYCYFIQLGPKSNLQRTDKFSFTDHNLADEYIININNGKIFKLDKTVLRTILQDDPVLLEELNNDKTAKGKLLIDYIEQYNARHADEIKQLRPEG